MMLTILNSRSFFIVLGITVLCMLTFIAVHQPQQFSPGSIIGTSGSGGGSNGFDDRLIPFRVDDFVVHISEKVLDGIRNEKLLCPTTTMTAAAERNLREVTTSGGSKTDGSGMNRILKLPTLYIITPTYKRPEQIPDMTRLAQTLMHVPSILWLIVEDAELLNPNVAEIAKRSGIPFIHLSAPMPKEEQKKKVKARGVSNRNRGLQWIRESEGVDPNGVIYFADDDNTYDLRLFEEIRTVKRLGMFPVGLITSTGVSTPIVKNGVVTGFYDGWIANRKFPVDMAGFAFSVGIVLKKPKAQMPFIPGYEEDRFLQSLDVKMEDIEPKASNCTQIYVWHTQTKKNKPPVKSKGTYENTNIDILYQFMES